MTYLERFRLGGLVDRPMLRSALDEAFNRRITLIVAEAGAGKTTLLRQWSASHTERDFVFLDIDDADDDPLHFARRFVDALAGVDPTAALRISPAMSVHDAGLGAPLVEALGAVLDAMPDIVIVIDDVQRFSNVRLVADLGDLVRRIPHNVHLVLSSRLDPPIALSRYRLDDELLEFRQSELAFNDTESAELLERIIGYSLSASQVRALTERTEGWAAGLQLAGLNLRHEPDPDAFIADFGGSDRLVADYLGEEVLAFLSPERRNLLLQMSALDEMCASLVEVTTECGDAQSVLEDLEHESMFLVPLDTRREWFRFHVLFRNLLRSRLSAEDPNAEVRILIAATDWHLARGRAKAAVEYLLRAQEWDRALEAILANAADVVAHGDLLTVVRWMLRVPEPVRSERISEELLAGVLNAVDDREVGRETITAPAEAFNSSRSHDAPRLAFIAAQVLWRSRPEISVVATRRKLDDIESAGQMSAFRSAAVEDSVAHADALITGGRSSFLAGDWDGARSLLSRGLLAAGSEAAERVSGLSTLSLVEAWCGNIERADSLVFDALLTAREAGMLAHPSIADAYLASVLTALERGEPALPGIADSTLREVVLLTEHEAHDSPAPLVRDRLLAVEGRTLRLGGAPDEALNALGGVRTIAPTVLFERAAASLTLGDTARARDIVHAWDDLIAAPEPLSIVQFHILRAWLAASDDAPDEATRHLTEAVKIAEIYGLVEVFVRAGPFILQRLSAITGPQEAFSDLIRARAEQSAARHQESDLPDPLTDRELEILEYLPTRFTNGELAERCFVSVNTIKTHMAHIYRKLEATDRNTAIDRARQLGLL